MLARIAALIFLFSLALPVIAQKRPAAKPKTPPRTEQQQSQIEQEQQDRQAIEDLHQTELNARMAYDVNAISELCDDEVVVMPPEHAPIQGKEAYRAFLQQGAKGFENIEILAYNQQWQEVRTVAEYAYEWGSIQMRTRPAAGQAETQTTMDVMRVLKRQPSGAWKIYRTIWNAAIPAQQLAPEKKPLQEIKK